MKQAPTATVLLWANFLSRKCWQDEAEKRPSIEDINKTIGKMLLNESLTEEVDDFLASRQQWVEEFDRQIEVSTLV